MTQIVLKFGGSSLANPECIRQVSRVISDVCQQGFKPIVIVSAMYGETDRLIRLVESVSGNADTEAYDFLISTGEHTSVALLCMVLQQMGYHAKPRSAWQIGLTVCDDNDTLSASLDVWSIHQMTRRGIIPVVTGFQAINAQMTLTTLGRGGSDLSAVIIAEKLGVDCHIYTDVRGVYAADPKVIPKANRLRSVHIDMMLKMSSLGAKVLQYKAIDYASQFNVRLKVLSTFSPDQGTDIYYGHCISDHAIAIQSLEKLIYIRIKGSDVNRLSVDYLKSDLIHKNAMSISCYQYHEGYLSLICSDDDYETIMQFLQLQFKLNCSVDLYTQSQVSAISVVSSSSLSRLSLDDLDLDVIDCYDSQTTKTYVVMTANAASITQELAEFCGVTTGSESLVKISTKT